MNEEKTKNLADEFPELFVDLYGDKRETCMAWGITCGDGWFDLIYYLCANIQNYITSNHMPQPKILQIKEKFGKLRFYISESDDYIRGMKWMAETISGMTCEICGEKGTLHLMAVRCKKHRKKENYGR